MPTGYTEAIKDGISFEQFVWRCARAFGALITMRDDPQGAPIPERLEPSPYFAHHLAECERAVVEFDALTDAQFSERQAALAALYNAQRAERRAQVEHQAMLYRDMLFRVAAWTPPTPDHIALKDFMTSQITRSLEWDCAPSQLDELVKPATRDEVRADLVEALNWAQKANVEELERVAARNAWIDALRASVPEPRSSTDRKDL